MELIEVFEDIVRRVPLRTIQKTFNRFEKTAGTTVDGTKTKVEKMIERNDKAELEVLRCIEQWYLTDHLYYGEKGVYLYRVGKEKALHLIETLSAVSPEDSKYTKRFPLTVPKDQLDPEDTSSYLVEVKSKDDGGVSLVFSTVRFYPKRFNIDTGRLLSHEMILKA